MQSKAQGGGYMVIWSADQGTGANGSGCRGKAKENCRYSKLIARQKTT